ncbi:unnamed protein product [Microthlaspi erraticum]|uniref:Uncharacterized protein n=1 Tax=Microthlaspi erraticum TaxID=1685480 RepID=A0A6D2IRZ9_9BRAS|nr:unnamed protein product [Microthlaspi erraticum]
MCCSCSCLVHAVRWTELLEVVAREGAVLEAVVAGRERGGRAGRGRGRGLPEESGESVAPSVHTASVTQSVPLAGDASVGLGAGAAPGGGGAPAPGRDDLVVGLLTQLLARFPPVVPQGAPGVPPVAEVQHVAADVAQPEAVDAGVTVIWSLWATCRGLVRLSSRASWSRGGRRVASESGAELSFDPLSYGVLGGVSGPLFEWRCSFVVAGRGGPEGILDLGRLPCGVQRQVFPEAGS